MYKNYRNYKDFKNDFYWQNIKLQKFIENLDTNTCWIFENCIASDPAASRLDIFYHSLDGRRVLSIIGTKANASYEFKVFKIYEK